MSDAIEPRFTHNIGPQRALFDLRIGELWRYRHLVTMFVRRDLVAGYKQTILGPVWLIVPPLITTAVFTIVFGNLAQLSSNGLPHVLFYMSGIIIWGYFNGCVSGNANTFMAQSGIFGKVYFPRLIVPISNVLATGFSTVVQLAIFCGFLAYYMAKGMVPGPTIEAVMVPFLLPLIAGMAIGVGIIISAVTAKYRDLSFLIGYGMQLWMYATTVIYPLSSVPAKYRELALLNPMTSVIETFRYAMLGRGAIPWWGLAYAVGFAGLSLFVGLVIFNRAERVAMDTI